MKKGFLSVILMMTACVSWAQNFQLHYDFGRKIYSDEEATRPMVTLTYEQFKADGLGNWFWFVDFDMYHDGMKGAYAEISREFTISRLSPSLSLEAHVEYDGGMTTFKSGGGTRFQNAALVGAAINGHNADFSTTWSVQALYKQNFKYENSVAYPSMQLTGVWSTTFASGKCTFSGYIDLWRGEKTNGHGTLVMMTEPQLWYNISKHFSVGTEVEISDNFVMPECATDKSFYVNPTLAVKYNF